MLRYTATPQQLLSSSAVEASKRNHLISLALDGSLGGSMSVISASFACSVAGTSGTSYQLKFAKTRRYLEIPTRRLNLLMGAFRTTTIIKAVLGGANPANRKEQCSVGPIGTMVPSVSTLLVLFCVLNCSFCKERHYCNRGWYRWYHDTRTRR